MKRMALELGSLVVGALLAFVAAAASLSWLFARWGDEDVAACRQMWLSAKDTSGSAGCGGLRFNTLPLFAGAFLVTAVTLLVLAGIRLARIRSAERDQRKEQAIIVRSVDVGAARPGDTFAGKGRHR